MPKPCDICDSDRFREILAVADNAYIQCDGCGMISSRDIPNDYLDQNEQAFAAELASYARKIEKRARHYKVLKSFDSHRRNNRFLELGCNAGAVLMAAEDKG